MSATSCSICASNRVTVINAFLAADRPLAWIEREMKRMKQPTKSETVKRHLDNCLGGNRANTALLESALTGRNVGHISPNRDFAQAVRAEANRLLAEGKLQINASHGLAAQQLIDRRVEKQADRRLLVQIASLLAGGGDGPPEALIEEGEVIEGTFTEVNPEDKKREEYGMAPLALVAKD